MIKKATLAISFHGIYRLISRSEQSMFTLYMLLGDGLFKNSYIDFLNDENSSEFYGNVVSLKKNKIFVTVELDPNIMEDSTPFRTSVSNLRAILQEYFRFEKLKVDLIKIIFNNDDLLITSSVY